MASKTALKSSVKRRKKSPKQNGTFKGLKLLSSNTTPRITPKKYASRRVS